MSKCMHCKGTGLDITMTDDCEACYGGGESAISADGSTAAKVFSGDASRDMTKFNPDNKDTMTYRECLGPAMEITDEADAAQYFADYVSFIQKALDKEPRNDEMTAAQIAKINLGYYAGYYDAETRERVERLFSCTHPVFGGIAEKGAPTTEEAFSAGASRV